MDKVEKKYKLLKTALYLTLQAVGVLVMVLIIQEDKYQKYIIMLETILIIKNNIAEFIKCINKLQINLHQINYSQLKIMKLFN